MSQPLLTLGQFILLILVIIAVLIAYELRLTLVQLRRTLSRADDTMDDLRAVIREARPVIGLLRARAEGLSSILQQVEQTGGRVAGVLEQLTNYLLKPLVLLSSLVGGLKAAFAAVSGAKRKKKGGESDVGRE